MSCIKEGLRAWRHFLVAADCYPQEADDFPEPNAGASLPVLPVAPGITPHEVADDLERRYPKLMAASRGELSERVRW
jgi:hypothetical protein